LAAGVGAFADFLGAAGFKVVAPTPGAIAFGVVDFFAMIKFPSIKISLVFV
jgi:bacteriorhodopsin